MQPGLVPVELTLNEQDFSADEVLFEYLQPMEAAELAPSRGPTSGGTLVNVSGSGFSRRAALLAADARAVGLHAVGCGCGEGGGRSAEGLGLLLLETELEDAPLEPPPALAHPHEGAAAARRAVGVAA